MADLVIGERLIHGEIKPEGVKEILPAERLKGFKEKNKEAKTPLSFTVVRVEGPELTFDLEKNGIPLKGR